MRTLLAGLAFGLTLALAGTASANPPSANSCSDCGTSDEGCRSSFSWRPGYFAGKCWSHVKAPCPSNAPTRRVNAPLAFQSHPYVRSPRDYFMQD